RIGRELGGPEINECLPERKVLHRCCQFSFQITTHRVFPYFLIAKNINLIGVSSTINEGSEFWIELSGSAEVTSAKTQKNKPLTAVTLKDKDASSHFRILVAEDNPTNQTLIINQLKTLGYKAELVNNGQEALNKIVNNNYHLLLTDCNMPLMDGYQLAKTVRESGNSELPIIALTADAYPESKAKCLRAGMNAQITKPFNLETLQEILESYLN
ncbi:MAG: response regulator, partial [Gammaproteobacteria bacterium]|nr:response regulator [Gammaproteobacteria bacterium]